MTILESDVAVFGNADLWLANNTGAASQIRFYEANTGTGGFPSSDYYTSFEAPALGDTIAYILPAVKPTSVGQILEVSAINGDTITLIWGTDGTTTDSDDLDVRSAIGVPDQGARLEKGMRELEAQLEVREQLLEVQMKRIETLQTELQTLEKAGPQFSSEGIESNANRNVQNPE